MQTQFLKSEKSLQFRHQNAWKCKLNNYFGAKTFKLQIFSLRISAFQNNSEQIQYNSFKFDLLNFSFCFFHGIEFCGGVQQCRSTTVPN